jgi:hypothetical protein
MLVGKSSRNHQGYTKFVHLTAVSNGCKAMDCVVRTEEGHAVGFPDVTQVHGVQLRCVRPTEAEIVVNMKVV